MMIGANVIQAAYKTKVEKLLFLGLSCIYPQMAPQSIREDALPGFREVSGQKREGFVKFQKVIYCYCYYIVI